jgi:hypothetical protein
MHSAFDFLHGTYAEALNGLNADETQFRPVNDPRQWCAQELIEHLILVGRSASRAFEDRLRKGRPTQAQATPEQEMRWRATVAVGRLPMGMTAPEPVCPGQLNLPALCGAELASQLSAEMELMDGLLDQCAEKFGSQPMASHFAFGPLSAEQWREFYVVHGRHHLGQMERILAVIRRER